MKRFSKRINNLTFWVVALLGLGTLFQEEIKKIGINLILSLSAVILIMGFTTLIILTINEFEKKIKNIEQKFIREKDLNKIRTDIKSLKLIINKNE